MLDTVNLRSKLAAELDGCTPAGLLDTYHHERHLADLRGLPAWARRGVPGARGDRAGPVPARIARIVIFLDPALFSRFSLPHLRS
jgi:hypothetical protein